MTADLVKGKSFRGALRYNLEKVGTKGAKILDTNFSSIAERDIMKEIFLVRMQRPALGKYFYHTSLNFPPDENLSDQKITAIAKEFLYESGFTQHQYILFRHHDAGHPHVHLLVNRIGFDGSVVSDSRDYTKAEQILRLLEVKHGLRQVPSSRCSKERAVTHDELEMMKRTKSHSTKVKLQVQLKDILSRKPTTDQFIAELERRRINILFNQATTRYISGISFGYEGKLFKGGSLGNAFKWNSIKNSMDFNLERDRESIIQANAHTRSSSLMNNIPPQAQEYILTNQASDKVSITSIKPNKQSGTLPASYTPRSSDGITRIDVPKDSHEQVHKVPGTKDYISDYTTKEIKSTSWNGLINSTVINPDNSYNDSSGVSHSINDRRRRKKRKCRI
jgi:hypothetical protein